VFPADSVLPNIINLSDGGASRQKMRIIGEKGLESVLGAMNIDTTAMTAEHCRKLLWECDLVTDQFTEAEGIAAAYGAKLIYFPKSPPRFSPNEPFFRSEKFGTKNQFDIGKIREHIVSFEKVFTSPAPDSEASKRISKWFSDSEKAAEYFDKGGDKNLKQKDLEKFELDTLPGRLPQSGSTGARRTWC